MFPLVETDFFLWFSQIEEQFNLEIQSHLFLFQVQTLELKIDLEGSTSQSTEIVHISPEKIKGKGVGRCGQASQQQHLAPLSFPRVELSSLESSTSGHSVHRTIENRGRRAPRPRRPRGAVESWKGDRWMPKVIAQRPAIGSWTWSRDRRLLDQLLHSFLHPVGPADGHG